MITVRWWQRHKPKPKKTIAAVFIFVWTSPLRLTIRGARRDIFVLLDVSHRIKWMRNQQSGFCTQKVLNFITLRFAVNVIQGADSCGALLFVLRLTASGHTSCVPFFCCKNIKKTAGQHLSVSPDQKASVWISTQCQFSTFNVNT